MNTELRNYTGKVKFRFHKGGLEESMATCKTFDSRSDFIEWMQVTQGIGDIYISEDLGPDDRIGWPDVRYVMSISDDLERYVVGMITYFGAKHAPRESISRIGSQIDMKWPKKRERVKYLIERYGWE